MYTAASFAAGFVFGLGLLVSGMANPAKVLAFLDLAGAWDPSLALVMAGAVAVGGGAFAYMKRRTRTLLGAPVLIPARAASTGGSSWAASCSAWAGDWQASALGRRSYSLAPAR